MKNEKGRTNITHQLEIKPADLNDMTIIANFIRSSAEWYEPFLDEKDLDQHYVDESWINENYKKRDFYIGKTDQNEGVGTISLQFFEDVTYLGYIYLHAKHVGKGFGHRLIRHAEEISKNKGQKGMVLIAHPEAKWAVKAYEKYGFKKLMTDKKDITNWKNGLLKSYYEEGFHLYHFDLTA